MRCRLLSLLCLFMTYPLRGSSATVAQTANDYFPAVEWRPVKPEVYGYSSAKLEALRAWLKAGDTTAMMIVVHGHPIFDYGDIARATKVASIRKSVLSMLYGKYVMSGAIDLNKTVTELHLEEPGRPFLPIEANATLGQLLAGRSGIYLLPVDVGPEQDLILSSQPRRGSQYPGSYFQYNDWDFNAAGTAFTRLTGRNIYDALRDDLAVPIGMQDFDRARRHSIPHPHSSVHPEYAMWLSTRDLARLGQLMLAGGNWRGKQLIPSQWIGESASVITPLEEMNPPMLRALGFPERWGFGYMWWTWDAAVWPGKPSNSYFAPYQGAYQAAGTGGQYLTVLPARDMVVVHKVDIDRDWRAAVGREAWDAILEMAVESTCDRPGCKEKSAL